MNPIENWYVMVLEVMQRENVRTSSHFKTALFLDRSTVQEHYYRDAISTRTFHFLFDLSFRPLFLGVFHCLRVSVRKTL